MDISPRIRFILVIIVVAEQVSSAKTLLDPFPLGTIGCLVSDVCDEGERCKDDLLFGRCEARMAGSGDSVRYDLQPRQVARLDVEIRRLIRAGFTWRDAYTQCVLQNTLVEFAFSSSFDHNLCEETLAVSAWADDVTDEVADVLEAIIEREDAAAVRAALDGTDAWTRGDADSALDKRALAARDDTTQLSLYGGQDGKGDYLDTEPRGDSLAEIARYAYLRDQGRGGYLSLNEPSYGYPSFDDVEKMDSNKRDEIVKIHKYFDKSKGQLKRDSYDENGDDYRNLYNSLVYRKNNQDPFSLRSPNYQPQQNDRDDSSMLKYIPLENNQPLSGTDRYPSFLSRPDTPKLSDFMEQKYPIDRNKLMKTYDADGLMSEGSADDTLISPEDESVLMGLLDGIIDPTDLSLADQARLAAIVKSLIEVLQTGELDVGAPVFDDATSADPRSPALPLAAATPAIDFAAFKGADGVVRADIVRGGEEDLQTELPILPAPEFLRSELAKAEIMEKKFANDNDKGDTDDAADSSTQTTEDHSTLSPRKLVQGDTFFLEVSKDVNRTRARAFLVNFTKSLGIEEELENLEIEDIRNKNEIKVTVNADSPMSAVDIVSLTKDDKKEENNQSAEKLQAWEKENDPEIKLVEAWLVDSDGTAVDARPSHGHMVLTLSLVGAVAGVVLAVVTIYLVKKQYRSRQKLQKIATQADGGEASKDYQDLCRQRMQGKTSEKPEPLHAAQRIGGATEAQRSPSSRSSTSSWSEEPAATNMDISTGHIVLAYMEDHLKNQDRLDKEWEAVSGYVADPGLTNAALDTGNTRKSRFSDVMPYDHSRVILASSANVANSDFINASFITDHDPRNPAYICTQGPLPHTVADFWQMVWEQGSVVIVMLTRLVENGASLCHRYWPEEGSDLYHIYEVHLVSEHIWCDDYLVRSFYLKNLQTNETRTVTQFHFLTWPQLSVPASIKALLDFRRKVNKSFRGRSCPIVVHCSDGCGRSGTYCLIDMVLNKMAKGAKEIDMAATLEHIRDQRMSVVETKEQFQFSLAAVAEEVHAILKALPQ